MSKRRFATLLLIGFTALPLPCQVYLITGSPNPLEPSGGYPTLLLRVDAAGKVTRVAQLTSSEEGTQWIDLSTEVKRAVIVPRNPVHTPVRVIDLDTGTAVKSCTVPSDGFPMGHWIWNIPGDGPRYVMYVGNPGGHDEFRGLSLDPAVPCDRSFRDLGPTEAKYMVSAGYAGVADIAGGDTMPVTFDRDRVQHVFPGLGIADFDVEVPSDLHADLQRPFGAIMANNRSLLALSISEFSDGSKRRLLVLRKSDRSWRRLPDVSEEFSWTRAYANFISIVAAQKKRAGGPASPGGDAWRKERTETGPATSVRLSDSKSVFSGQMHIYDVDTGRTFSVVTNQADSEVLLVESGILYYRISDKLYSAPILETSLGVAKLLAADDIIRDAHWAFVKRN